MQAEFLGLLKSILADIATSNMEEDDINTLKKLDIIVKQEVSNVFYGVGEIGGQICAICSEINRAIDCFLSNATVDLSDAIVVNFLKSTLPVLVEVFLRRSTLRCVHPLT